MKKLTLILVVAFISITAMASDWDGTTAADFGTQLANAGESESNPIIITTPMQWMHAANLAAADTTRAKKFALGDNLDFKGLAGAKSFGPLTAGAVFDGKGFVVTNIILDGTKLVTPAAQGLFTTITSATVKNLGLTGSGSITGLANTGGIVVTAKTSTISNCFNTTPISGDIVSAQSANLKAFNIGGIVGNCNGAIIQDCYNTGVITGVGRVAGIAGTTATAATSITRCYNTGAINAVYRTGAGVYGDTGGILGYAGFTVTIESCYNKGNVSIAAGGSGNAEVGGIVGNGTTTAATINNCFNTGNISIDNTYPATAATSAGGIIACSATAITNCYNTGTITNPKTPNNGLGGIIGLNTARGIPTNCYTLAGVGYNDGATAGTYVSTTVIKDPAGLQDPSFVTTLNNNQNPAKWAADVTPQINNGYPILDYSLLTGLKQVYRNNDAVVVKDKSIQIKDNLTSIEVYNLSGKCIFNKQNVAASTFIALPNTGVYLVKAKTEKSFSTQKIMIK